ncbi:queuosine precursor transporter [Neobacillus sedimentimangrovi]|jgi:queuosine precursor transporter|uniref:Probable queuosine precursor transporter n=1 Tax=Neobacillus sedimentimangrovi TaxID=2699460 RepID=A0ABS8QFP3_9BACI|nr:queuosine precursor transporter [Neobacillus sedimentimangrovi]AIM16500.1 transporter [Bacillus sp. X1(2014)]MCD4838055.1 queuosine precursor transporter [Neobacillus sedimentimangrovi]
MLFYLNGIFTGLLILANITAVKLFHIGTWVILPAAVIIYIFTYPIIDVITEVYGKKDAQRTVHSGLVTQILALVFITITIHLPEAPVFKDQESFETILNGSFRVVLASLISYTVSQHLDVFVFNLLKSRHGQKKLWLRNNASTMLSQLIDTTVFIVIAFYGTIPLEVLGTLIITQYIFKFLAAICTTPIVYFLVGIARKHEAKIL